MGDENGDLGGKWGFWGEKKGILGGQSGDNGALGVEVGVGALILGYFGCIFAPFRSPLEPSDDDSDDVTATQAPPPGEEGAGLSEGAWLKGGVLSVRRPIGGGEGGATGRTHVTTSCPISAVVGGAPLGWGVT